MQAKNIKLLNELFPGCLISLNDDLVLMLLSRCVNDEDPFDHAPMSIKSTWLVSSCPVRSNYVIDRILHYITKEDQLVNVISELQITWVKNSLITSHQEGCALVLSSRDMGESNCWSEHTSQKHRYRMRLIGLFQTKRSVIISFREERSHQKSSLITIRIGFISENETGWCDSSMWHETWRHVVP